MASERFRADPEASASAMRPLVTRSPARPVSPAPSKTPAIKNAPENGAARVASRIGKSPADSPERNETLEDEPNTIPYPRIGLHQHLGLKLMKFYGYTRCPTLRMPGLKVARYFVVYQYVILNVPGPGRKRRQARCSRHRTRPGYENNM